MMVVPVQHAAGHRHMTAQAVATAVQWYAQLRNLAAVPRPTQYNHPCSWWKLTSHGCAECHLPATSEQELPAHATKCLDSHSVVAKRAAQVQLPQHVLSTVHCWRNTELKHGLLSGSAAANLADDLASARSSHQDLQSQTVGRVLVRYSNNHDAVAGLLRGTNLRLLVCCWTHADNSATKALLEDAQQDATRPVTARQSPCASSRALYKRVQQGQSSVRKNPSSQGSCGRQLSNCNATMTH